MALAMVVGIGGALPLGDFMAMVMAMNIALANAMAKAIAMAMALAIVMAVAAAMAMAKGMAMATAMALAITLVMAHTGQLVLGNSLFFWGPRCLPSPKRPCHMLPGTPAWIQYGSR